MLSLAEVAASLRDMSLWNRLLVLPPSPDGPDLSLIARAEVVREVLSSCDRVPMTDPRLAALDDWASREPKALTRETIEARLERLAADDLEQMEDTGVSHLMLGLGLVWRRDPGAECPYVAPLMLCPVILEGEPGVRTLRRISVPQINPALQDFLGFDPAGLPADPLTWRAEDLATHGVLGITASAVLGLFDLPRYRQWQRLAVEGFPVLDTDPKAVRIRTVDSVEPWPQLARYEPTQPTRVANKMDGLQRELVNLSHHGVNMAIQGGPGTGKTHVVAHVIANAAAEGRGVLVMSGRLSAFRAVTSRLKNTILDREILHLYGAGCDPRAVAERYGVEPAETVRDTLFRLPKRPKIVMVTPASYALHFPKAWRYGILVIDEASLVSLPDALLAMASCEQVVICGDSQQMQKDPPLDELFNQDPPYQPPPSILDAAIAAKMPVGVLAHHYRSRHPALMHVTNWVYYGALMRIAPSPDPTVVCPYQTREVSGSYDWDTGENAVEAEAIVDEIARHVASGSRASVGVITMTVPQRDLIRRRIAERGLDLASVEGVEPLLVADYNGIQGEERDVILIALTFGPQPGETAWPTSYGALSLPGGERRLNVIMTRQRARMLLVHSFPWTSVNSALAKGHDALWCYLANGQHDYVADADPHEGVLASVLQRIAWQAMDFGNAVGMFDAQIGRFAGAIYITGRRDEATERSEIAQYEHSGWQVIALPEHEIQALDNDQNAQVVLSQRLRQQFSSVLYNRRIGSQRS